MTRKKEKGERGTGQKRLHRREEEEDKSVDLEEWARRWEHC